MPSENFHQGEQTPKEDKRANRSHLAPDVHMALDVRGVAERCIREGVIPEKLPLTETGVPRTVLIARVEEELVVLLRQKTAEAPTPSPRPSIHHRFFGTFHETRQLGRSIDEDIRGLVQRCLREDISPSELPVSETGIPRQVLISRIQEEIIMKLRSESSI